MVEIANTRDATPSWVRPPVYTGPERRSASRDAGPWITQMLDEVDYGMLLVGPDSRVVYMNHAARVEFDAQHPLQLQGRSQLLGAHRAQDVAPLYDALAAAQRGLRRLLTLGDGEHRVAVSVVPLPDASALSSAGHGGQGGITLLMLGKREVCAQLSVRGFARSQSLTPAETRVLELLCQGHKPSAIADGVGVAVSTVRTQIGSIRAKTGAASIRDLVRQVAVLPPLVGALRGQVGGMQPS
jgi:DNA-binding CsgD family transcriptional regulator